jgi:hypothetical protein
MDDEPLVAGRVYWALHGHRWVKAKVKRIVHKLDVNTLAEEDASELPPNAIGHIELSLQEPLATLPYARSRILGLAGAGGYRLAPDLGCRAGPLKPAFMRGARRCAFLITLLAETS